MAKKNRVRVCQCLCPSRHAILALVVGGSEAPPSDDQVKLAMRVVVNVAVTGRPATDKDGELIALLWKNSGHTDIPRIDPWCGICGAMDATWTYEVRSMRETNFEAAKEKLRRSELDQMLTAAFLRETGKTHTPGGSQN